jgi:hypothetical protein
MEATPALSVIVPTRTGWPGYEPVFRHHRREVEAVGGELLVVDGSGRPAPPAEAIGPRTRWLSHPGESVLGLRGLAYPLGRGNVVATSEDHTFVPEGWAAAILECHAEHPEAAAIGGNVVNGTTTSYAEWAAFLVGHDREIPPLGRATRVGLIGVTNVSYKRAALARLKPLPGIGINDAVFQRDLARHGATLLNDDRISCVHEQHMTFGQATHLLYQSGRMGAGTRRQHMTGREAARVLVTPFAPLILTARLGVWRARRGRYRLRYLAELPMLVWLYGARSVGELVGYARGAGDSALQLH